MDFKRQFTIMQIQRFLRPVKWKQLDCIRDVIYIYQHSFNYTDANK